MFVRNFLCDRGGRRLSCLCLGRSPFMRHILSMRLGRCEACSGIINFWKMLGIKGEFLVDLFIFG